jgi:hypothetical protein
MGNDETRASTKAQEGAIGIRLVRRRRLCFEYRHTWLVESPGGGPAPGRAARLDGGKAEIEILLEGDLRWRLESREDGTRQVVAWRGGDCPPRVAVRAIEVASTQAALQKRLLVLDPASGDPKARAGAFEGLARAIAGLAPPALERACEVVAARAWRESSESNPLLEVRLRAGEDPEDVLRRVAQQEWGRGEGAALRAALLEQVDLFLRLPPLSRTASRRCDDVLAASRAGLEGDGGIAVAAEDADSTASGVLITCGGHLALQEPAEAGFQLAFDHRLRNSAARSHFLLPRLLRRYGLDGEASAWLHGRTGEVETSLHVSVSGEAAASWLAFPAERRAAFYDQFTVVSRAVQRVLRAWLPYLHFQDYRRFEDTETAHALLVFSQLPPYRSKERSGFTYEVLRPLKLQKALRRVTKPLMELFVEVRQKLDEEGCTESVRFYTARQSIAVARTMGIVPKPFGVLMQAEEQLVGALMAFSAAIPDLAHHPEELFRSGALLARTLASRLRRIYSHQLFAPLAALLLVESTQALAVEQGKQAPLRVTLRLREDGGPEHVSAVTL